MQIKQFTISIAGDSISWSGNMGLDEAAAAIVVLASERSFEEGKKQAIAESEGKKDDKPEEKA